MDRKSEAIFLTPDLDPGRGWAHNVDLWPRDAESGSLAAGRRIWSASPTEYERGVGAKEKQKEEIFVRSNLESDPHRLAPARCFASSVRTHERNETITRLQTSLRKLQLTFCQRLIWAPSLRQFWPIVSRCRTRNSNARDNGTRGCQSASQSPATRLACDQSQTAGPNWCRICICHMSHMFHSRSF